MSGILSIDPGPEKSAYVIWDGQKIYGMDIRHNDIIIEMLKDWELDIPLVIEQVRSYGMAVGATVFDTVFWSGRFCQAWQWGFHQVPRLNVKLHLCHDSRAKDSNIRQALIDRFEPDLKPRQRPKGILKGLKTHLWAATALAVTFWDQNYG